MQGTEVEDAQQRVDELEALSAIYGDAVSVADDGQSLSVRLPGADSQPHLLLRAHLPEMYPSQHAPVFELHSDLVPEGMLAQWAAELELLFSPGEVVLYTWVEQLRERWDELMQRHQLEEEAEQQAQEHARQLAAAADAADAEALGEALEHAALIAERAASGRTAGPGRDHDEAMQLAMAEILDKIVHGEPFTEKRSTFQAHLAPVTNVQQVEAFMEILLQNNKIRQATHNIMAYRIERLSPATPGGTAAAPTFLQDFDDDGEDAAGGRLLHMLQLADCRNVCVVVSRWYGGILLGPARFAHINNAARQLLEACSYIGSDGGKKKSGKKR